MNIWRQFNLANQFLSDWRILYFTCIGHFKNLAVFNLAIVIRQTAKINSTPNFHFIRYSIAGDVALY